MFDYTKIPNGFYDMIFDGNDGIRKYWHWHKFDVIKKIIMSTDQSSILDIGCFAGTFLGRFMDSAKFECLGVDVLKNQVDYANNKFKRDNLEFVFCNNLKEMKDINRKFDIITLIEVIEHLGKEDIIYLFESIDHLTHPGSHVIFSTPNYLSLWPILEILLNKVSDVCYEEQHITKFTYFNIERTLQNIQPDIWDKYRVKHKTTTHFLSPYISVFNYKLAKKMSNIVSLSKWKNPFGSIIALHLIKQ